MNFLGVLLSISVLAFVSGQMIIPKRPLGFVYDNRSMDALIHLDVHFGPICPVSRDAFPNVKAVADHYGPDRVRLTMHLFPLPYHRNSFLAAMGAHVYQAINPNANTWDWFKAIYDNIERFSNDNTANRTTNEVIKMMSLYAGFGRGPTFVSEMKDEMYDTASRAAWKYSASRGIYGTPTFLLNDVFIEADPSWTIAEWKKVIDPLLATYNAEPCPEKTKRCEFLQGKVECCTKGEACIPNVGCRC